MSEPICPLMREPCIEHRCRFYVHVLGKNPQTGADVSKFDCTFAWLPMLLIEATKAIRETDDEISAFREDTRKTQQHFATAMLGAVEQHVPLLQREDDK